MFKPKYVKEHNYFIHVYYKEGYSYPDGGSGIEIEYVICPQCFKEKIIPYLESVCQNKVEFTQWDW